MLFVGILPLVALLAWSAGRAPAGSPSAPTSARHMPAPAEMLGRPLPPEAFPKAAPAAALLQKKISLSALQARAKTKADILRAYPLVTSIAAAATQSVTLTYEIVDANALQTGMTPTATATRQPALPRTAPPAPPILASPTFPPPGSYPLISGITDHSRQIFLFGQTLGNRANVFSKIGDSITANDVFLAPIGWGRYDLHQYTYLAPVIAYFSQANARTANSFANTSLAAQGGWTAWQMINPGAVFEPRICNFNETPLECEYRVVKPSVALIMIGTNDVGFTPAAQYQAELRQIIRTSIDQGIIPVVSTIPPLHHDWAVGRVEVINGIIVSLAREYDIPVWDYWTALQGLPQDCLSIDGVHPSVDTGHAADFSPDYILTGYAVRNLLALQALDAVWRATLH